MLIATKDGLNLHVEKRATASRSSSSTNLGGKPSELEPQMRFARRYRRITSRCGAMRLRNPFASVDAYSQKIAVADAPAALDGLSEIDSAYRRLSMARLRHRAFH